jgi:endo-1,4-beta-xylanase
VLAAAVLAALSLSPAAVEQTADAPGLKGLVPKGLLIGAAINQAQSDGRDAVSDAIVISQFNSISPENLLKWEKVHPTADGYDFPPADRYVAFGGEHGMAIIGHTLVWHQQTPAWVFAGKDGGKADRDMLLARMRSHIETVVGRYRGKIHGWDVVNEALEEDGTLRASPWRDIIGDDFIAHAFEYAHRADPGAELYYNDYNLWNPAKRAGALRIAKQLTDRGLRIDGIGEQAHWMIETPTLGQIEATIADIADAGLKVHLTELDVDVLPRDAGMYGADLSKKAQYKAETDIYAKGLPAEGQQQLARRYAQIFELVLKHRDRIDRVTFWGVTDAHTWLNNFPIPGRVNHPLLWDRAGKPKRAYEAVVGVLQGAGKGELR